MLRLKPVIKLVMNVAPKAAHYYLLQFLQVMGNLQNFIQMNHFLLMLLQAQVSERTFPRLNRVIS